MSNLLHYGNSRCLCGAVESQKCITYGTFKYGVDMVHYMVKVKQFQCKQTQFYGAWLLRVHTTTCLLQIKRQPKNYNNTKNGFYLSPEYNRCQWTRVRMQIHLSSSLPFGFSTTPLYSLFAWLDFVLKGKQYKLKFLDNFSLSLSLSISLFNFFDNIGSSAPHRHYIPMGFL